MDLAQTEARNDRAGKASSNLTDCAWKLVRQLEASPKFTGEAGGWQLEVSPVQELAAERSIG
jgi:hypothetical protein